MLNKFISKVYFSLFYKTKHVEKCVGMQIEIVEIMYGN